MTFPGSNPIDRLLRIRHRIHMQGTAARSEVLRQLLQELSAPETLPGGLQIAHNAYVALTRISASSPAEEQENLDPYICELRWLARCGPRLAGLIFDNDEDKERFLRCSKGNPVRGTGYEVSALWSLLWERHPDPNLAPAFSGLQAEAVMSQIAILRQWVKQDDWVPGQDPADKVLHSIYVRILAIKHFVMKRYVSTDDYCGALSQLSDRRCEPIMLSRLKVLRRALRSELTLSEESPQILKDISSIIGLIVGGNRPADFLNERDDEDGEGEVEESTEDENASESEEVGTIEQKDDHIDVVVACISDQAAEETEEELLEKENDGGSELEGEDDTEDRGGLYSRTRCSGEDRKKCEEAGAHPDEMLRVEKFVLSERRSGGSLNAVAMRHQSLRSDWSYAAMEEVASGMEILRSVAERGNVLALELFAFANATLARGLTVNAARSIVVRSDRPSEVETLTLVIRSDESSPSEWIRPAVPIRYHQEHPSGYPGCRNCVKSLPLPDYWGVGAVIRKLIEAMIPNWDGTPIRPFDSADSAENRTMQLKNLLVSSDPVRALSLQNRFTLPRIGRVLFQNVYVQTRESYVYATYLTGQTHDCGEVDRYYDSPSVSLLQQIDRDACRTMQEELAAVGYQHKIDLSLTPSTSSGYIGSPLCPGVESIREFVSQTAEAIVEAYAAFEISNDRADLIRLNNAMTVYTYVGVTIGTCHRPNHGGLPKLASIDEFDAMMSIADKGIRRARLSTAADRAFAQLEAWQEYISWPDVRERFGIVPDQTPFLIEPDGTVMPVSVSTLSRHLPFAANFARHFVRTEVAERCARGETSMSMEHLSALLGHAAEGEEQYGPYSSFRYGEFCEVVRAELDRLLENVGFRPLSFAGKEVVWHGPSTRRILRSAKT